MIDYVLGAVICGVFLLILVAFVINSERQNKVVENIHKKANISENEVLLAKKIYEKNTNAIIFCILS